MLYSEVTWWWKIKFAGRTIRESAKTNSKELARRAEVKRRRELEEGYHGLKKRQAPQTFKSASDDWLKLKQPTVAAKTHLIEKTNLGHILPILGQEAPDRHRCERHQPLSASPPEREGGSQDHQPRSRHYPGHPPSASPLGEPAARRADALGARRHRQGVVP